MFGFKVFPVLLLLALIFDNFVNSVTLYCDTGYAKSQKPEGQCSVMFFVEYNYSQADCEICECVFFLKSPITVIMGTKCLHAPRALRISPVRCIPQSYLYLFEYIRDLNEYVKNIVGTNCVKAGFPVDLNTAKPGEVIKPLDCNNYRMVKSPFPGWGELYYTKSLMWLFYFWIKLNFGMMFMKIKDVVIMVKLKRHSVRILSGVTQQGELDSL